MGQATAQLLPSPPRRIRRVRGFGMLAFQRFVIAPALVLIVLFLVFAWWASAYGTRTQGRIHEVYEKKFSNGETTLFARYSYDLDGVTHRDEQRVSGTYLSGLKPNEEVPVRTVNVLGLRYSTLADGSKGFLDLYVSAITMMMVALFVASGLIAHRGWLVPARQAKLVREGQATPATVTALDLLPGRAVTYRFNSDQGEEFTGVSRFIGPLSARPNIGDRLTVIYDPRNPARHVVYEYGDFEILP